MVERKAFILRTDGTREDLDHRPSLTEGQKAVGGYVEHVRGRYEGKVCDLYCDEDGLSNRRPFNPFASAIAQRTIVGDVMVLQGWQTLGSD